MPSAIKLARVGLHYWEEPCISGVRGSGAIFFSGCTLSCVYCQNHEISHNKFGKEITTKRLAEIFAEIENLGAHNINFVTPTHFFDKIIDALKIYKPKIPLVYNSSGYELSNNIEKDIFDVYLFDLKYIDDEKAAKYSKSSDYFSFATEAIKTAYKLKGKAKFDANGMMTSGVVIRHLLLPNATNDAIKIIDWCFENCHDAVFSLMSQYIPFNTENYPHINRKVTQREYDKVVNHLSNKDFAECYIQELSSSTCDYIPNFDLSGI